MSNGLRIANGVFSIGANGFSTAYRYLRQVANPADKALTMVQGPSIVFRVKVLGSAAQQFIAWRYECGALTFSGGYNATHPSPGFAVDKDVGF